MKRIFITILSVLAFIWHSGCKKYLDIKPMGYGIPTTVEDYEKILNRRQFIDSIPNEIEDLSDNYISGEKGIGASPWYTNNLGFHCYNVFYESIYQYNTVINGIDGASDGTISRKIIAKAKAKIGRALCYWYLINLYAKPYRADEAANDPGLSLIAGNDINLSPPARASVQSVYDFIIRDLTEAIPSLPVTGHDQFQLSKEAGYSILARTYLTMNNYAKAREAAEQALELNNQIRDYNLGYASLLTMPVDIYVQYRYFRNVYILASDTEKLFSPDDLRRINFGQILSVDDLNEIVFSQELEKYADPSTWDGIVTYRPSLNVTTEEMYLIRAEASARAGNIQAALADLNKLRKNRIKSATYTDLTATGTVEAVKLVLLERRRELLFKGARWFDMRRLNNDPDYGFTARRYFIDGTYTELAPNSLRYVLRLPSAAVSGAIIQNP